MASNALTIPRTCCDDDCLATVASTRFDKTAIDGPCLAFSALGDEIRLKIVHLLAQHDALCVCELEQAFDVGQPTISHHLKILREAHLVDVQRRGTWAYYSLRRDALKALTRTLHDVI